MRRIVRGLLCASVLPAITVFASPVFEMELNGQGANNSRATAQALLPIAFTNNADLNVFGTLPTVSISGKSSEE